MIGRDEREARARQLDADDLDAARIVDVIEVKDREESRVGTPPLLLAIAMFAIGGFPLLIWGFCLPTMTLSHATFAINTVNHMFGSRRFETVDESRNNPFTALFAVGEGWHNNHHRYQRAARNGFYWWEFDPTWYVIRAMKAVGLAWDVQAVPKRIYDEARVVKAKRATRKVPSIIEAVPLSLELAEEPE